MSKQTLSIIIVGLILIGAGLYFALVNKKVQPLTSIEDTSVLLYVEDGDVSYKTEGMDTFQKATTSPTLISNNTLVYTGLGRASVLFPNNSSVSLDQYTELKVTYADKKVTLFQTLGVTYHRVEALVTGATYEVETPGTVASVRGTKFAVKYDNKTKETKVAVTESKVQVSAFTPLGTASSTKEIKGTFLLEEGKTARMKEVRQATQEAIDVVETEQDAEMKVWVEVNKKRDSVIDTLRAEIKDKQEARVELKSMLRGEKEWNEERYKKENREENSIKENTEPTKPKEEDKASVKETPEERKESARTEQAKEEKKQTEVKEETKKESTAEGSGSARTVVKMNEEAFFDRFNTMFINYFYIDEEDSTCKVTLTPSQRVSSVTSFAKESGYPFSSSNLLDFAQAISTYCDRKDANVKVKLQGRFDVEFPYKENI